MNIDTVLYYELGIGGEEYKKGQWREIVIHDDKNILGFFGEFRFLSNTFSANICFDGDKYPSVENAYKAWRWKYEDRKYFQTCSPIEAIRYNRENIPNGPSVEEWNAEKFNLMLVLNRQKYDKHLNPELHELLLSTGQKYLAEKNWWGDTYWGIDLCGNGENNLGQILMQIREELKN